MNTIDLINIRGHQSVLEKSINPIEIKTENDMVKNIIEKHKKKQQSLHLKVCFFQV